MAEQITAPPGAQPAAPAHRSAPPTASGASPATFPPAELDRRFYAAVLDRLLVWTIAAAAIAAAYLWLLEPGHTAAAVAAMVATVLVLGTASAVLLGLRGTSPGRAALGLRVVDVATGAPIGVGRALLRTVVLALAALPTLGLATAALAWTAVMDPSGRRRGWHDLRAGSVVVDVRPLPEADDTPDPTPRTIVNLTAMRLVPRPPAPTPVTPVRPPRPEAPPAPPAPPAPHGRPPAAPPPGQAPAARWRVTFDTGETLAVEGLTLVGRSPEPRPGEPVRHLVPLRSSDMSLSKTHAQFQVVPDGALVVMDRGSTNGSMLLRGGVARDLAAGRPATLLHEDRVRFGDRTMTVIREA